MMAKLPLSGGEIRIGGEHDRLIKATARDVDFRQISNREVRKQVEDTYIAEFIKRCRMNPLDPRTEVELTIAARLIFEEQVSKGRIMVDIRLK